MKSDDAPSLTKAEVLKAKALGLRVFRKQDGRFNLIVPIHPEDIDPLYLAGRVVTPSRDEVVDYIRKLIATQEKKEKINADRRLRS